MRATIDRTGTAVLLAVAAAVGASCSAPAPPHPQLVASAVPVENPSAAPPGDPPSYEVHEWGLVRADQGDTVRVGAVAPPIPPEVLIMDKPVLYFHANAPMTLRSVAVVAPGGRLIETWPLADQGRDEHTMSWSNVSMDPISACKSSPLPRKGEAPCLALRAGDLCESLGLAAVRTVDSACVRVGGKTETFLFYRVETTSLTPPLRFTNQNDGDVLVSNDGDEPIPGVLIRIETEQAATRTLTVSPPLPRRTVLVGREFPTAKVDPSAQDEGRFPRPRTVTGPARGDIGVMMRGLGLRDSEVRSFMKSWDETLFGSPDNGGFRPLVKAGTAFLYFLPERAIERAAKVTFDPPPRSFRRAFAVWTHLSPSEAR